MEAELKQLCFDCDDKENTEINIFLKKYKWYHINVNILPAKLCYLLENAKLVGYAPNLVLFLTGIGLSKTETGMIMGLRLIGKLIGGPFWGIIADKWNCHKSIVIILCLMSLMSMCSQPFVSLSFGNPEINHCPEPNPKFITSKPCNNTTLSNQCNSTNGTNQTLSVTSSTEISSTRYGSLFWIIFLLQIAVSFSEGNIEFTDTATLRKSQLSVGRKVEYGQQRMFAPIGAIIGITISNLAISYFPLKGITCYAGLFFPYAVLAIAATVPLLVIYRKLDFCSSPNNVTDVAVYMDFRKNLFKTLADKEVVLFFILTFFAGFSFTPFEFLYLYLKELDSPKPVYTLVIVMAASSALIGFCISSQMIKFFGGTWKSLAISFFAYGLRYLGTSLVTNPWLVIACEAFHIFSFCLFLSAGVYHVKEISTTPVLTTVVSIFNALKFAVGPLVGATLCGVFYEKYGARNLYRGFAVFDFAVGIFVVILAYFVLEVESPQDEKQTKFNGLLLPLSTQTNRENECQKT